MMIDKIKYLIGVVFQNSVLDGVLTVKDNLESRASLYGIVGKGAKDKIQKSTDKYTGIIVRSQFPHNRRGVLFLSFACCAL